MNEHPDFLGAPPERRFSGGTLKHLFARLDAEAAPRPERRPYYVLPDGALVSMRYTDADSRVITISRSEKPKTDLGYVRWKSEVDTFVKHFSITDWAREDDPAAKGVRVRLTEPAGMRCGECGGRLDDVAIAAMGEVCTECALKRVRSKSDEASHLVPCSGCGHMVVFDYAHPPDGQNCMGCAFAAGREYTRQVHARLAAERAAK